MDIACQDSQALIEISSGKEKFEKTGEIIQSINIYKESPVIDIVITSRDGNHKKKYHLDLQKATYLSDLTWNEGATVGYGEIQKIKHQVVQQFVYQMKMEILLLLIKELELMLNQLFHMM